MVDIIAPTGQTKKFAREQRIHIRKLSEKVRQGKRLSEIEKNLVADMLIEVAELIQEPKQKKIFDPGSGIFEYAILRSSGISHTNALKKIGDNHGVSEVAVRKSFKRKYGDEFSKVYAKADFSKGLVLPKEAK